MKVPNWVLRWWQRLTTWGDVTARIWADYWLLIFGSLFVVGSVVLKWVQSPFSHDYSGLKLSLMHDPGVTPHVSPLSIGALAVIILIFALIFWRKNFVLLAFAASILIMLWAITPAQIAFRQPSVLRRLNYELDVMPQLNAFTKDYFLQNYGTPELVPKRPVLYSAWGRFLSAWAFLRLGWYCFGIGGVLIAGYAIPRIQTGRLIPILILLGLPLAALIIILTPPALGQHYYTEGILAKTAGRNQEAIAYFRRAMRWDLWHAQDVDLYATIGQLQKNAGTDFGSLERHILKAVNFRETDDYESAIYEFGVASNAGGELAETARREGASTRAAFGLALYQAGGAGAALTNWQLALAEDSNQIYVLPYLARAYYDTGRYQAGIDAATRLAKLVNDHNQALANAYSIAADCYAKLGNDAKARDYYNLSLAADPVMNFWAITGLAGD